ncbi:unnamed protein product [Microthlaspi erraticum]|uniref:RNase H type-1 domain-containing protein n=1 Tax=Microthlaspi erraticum TaxID=1685480 RepID=A0A6D2HVD3_9BRAS|nr:unnamed protein product [Microthlaspi erraticum]
MKEHEWPVTATEGTERTVRVEAELVEVPDHRKPPWRWRVDNKETALGCLGRECVDRSGMVAWEQVQSRRHGRDILDSREKSLVIYIEECAGGNPRCDSEGTWMDYRGWEVNQVLDDKWVSNKSLLDISRDDLPVDYETLTARDLWQDGVGWRWDRITPFVFENTRQELMSVVVDTFTGSEDRLSWTGNPNGEFTVRSAYTLLTENETPRQNMFDFFQRVWRSAVPERVRFFLWLIGNQSVMTNAERKRRHLCDSDICPVYVAKETIQAIEKHKTLSAEPAREERMIGWNPPVSGWFKLNTDGASRGNPGPAAAGGVIRNHHGEWCGGFGLNIGRCTAPLAELWGVYYGLYIALDKKITRLEVEVDSELVVGFLTTGIGDSHPLSFLVRLCHGLLAKDWLVRISHVYREANRLADGLANYALTLPLGFHSLPLVP